MELNRVCISLSWCDLSPHCQYFSRRKYKTSCLTFRLKSSSYFRGGIAGLHPLTVRRVCLFLFRRESRLKRDAVVCLLVAIGLACLSLMNSSRLLASRWLRGINKTGVFINGASGCAGMFSVSFFFNIGALFAFFLLFFFFLFCLNCSRPTSLSTPRRRC